MKPIFLIGYMGSGKTTLGRALAKEMECDFIDLDNFIEGRFRRTIKDIFAERGEEGFRKIEHNLLEEVAEFQDVIIACGGGTPCHYNNMDIMNSSGLAIYLTTPTSILLARLSLPQHKAKRPIIANKTDEELKSFIEKNLIERDPFYNKAKMKFDATKIETAEETIETAKELAEIIKLKLPEDSV